MKGVRQQYYSVSSGGSTFTPTSIANCALWLDATDSATVITSGGNVSAWLDKSGNSRNFAQTTSGNRPAYPGSGGTLDPAVTFTASSSTFLDVSDAANLAVGRSFTFFVVEERTSSKGENYFFGGSSLATNSNLVTGYYTDTIFLMAFLANDLVKDPVPAYSASADPIVWSFVYTGSFRDILSNGTSIVSDGNTQNLLGWAGASMGRFNTTSFYDGKIREVVWYTPSLSSTDRSTVETYLMNKYVTPPTSSVSRSFIPPDLSNCALWLDAADRQHVLTSGGSVSTWLDKSGNSRHVTQSTAGNRPTSVTSVPGDAYINFASASSQYLDISDANNIAVGRSFTFFAIEQRTSSKSENYFMGGSGLTTNSNLVSGYFNNTTFLVAFLANDCVIPVDGYNSADPPILWSFEYTDPNRAMIADGTSVYTDTNASDLAAWTNASFGRFNNAAYYEGRLREIVWFTPSLTEADRKKVEGYLAWKWGLQTNLSNGHTYRYNPVLEAQITPLSIANCLVWFDAADRTTITGTSPVTAWTNKGSLGGSAVNNTGTVTYTVDSVARPYLSFPTGADMLIALALNTQARTWFFVYRNTTQLLNSQANYAVLFNQTGTTGQNILYMSRLTGDNYQFVIAAHNVAAKVAGSIVNPFNNIGVYTLVNAASSASNVVTVTGSNSSLTTSSNAADYLTTSANYRISSADATNIGGDFFEILMYSGDLSPTDRRKIEAYLAWKWSLYPNLPLGHPYKSTRP